jgi:hypothetical protein
MGPIRRPAPKYGHYRRLSRRNAIDPWCDLSVHRSPIVAARQVRKTKNEEKLLLSASLGSGDVFFGHVGIRPGAAQIDKLNFQESNHFHF